MDENNRVLSGVLLGKTGGSLLDAGTTSLSGWLAGELLIGYTADAGYLLLQYEYTLLNSKLYELMYAGEPDKYQAHMATAQQIIDSFKIF
jgi:hypothetical protein